MNWLVGWLGYEWVADTRPYEKQQVKPRTDEGWDDLHQHAPRYVLRRKVAE